MTDLRNLPRSMLKSTIVVADGDYAGEVTRGLRRNGRGRQSFPNGDVYEGGFKDDLFDGAGVYTYACGSVYEGRFRRGLRDGPGELRVRRGDGFDVYTGTFRRGLREGRFTVAYANGDRFVGRYARDQKQSGRLAYASGAVYEGGFAGGRFDGSGRFERPGAFAYAGGFRAGARHGKGVERQGADRLKTRFDADRPAGKGVLVYDGKKHKSVWVPDAAEAREGKTEQKSGVEKQEQQT